MSGWVDGPFHFPSLRFSSSFSFFSGGRGWVRKWVKEMRRRRLTRPRPHNQPAIIPHSPLLSSPSPLRGNSREKRKKKAKKERKKRRRRREGGGGLLSTYALFPNSGVFTKIFLGSPPPPPPPSEGRVNGGNANDVKFEVFLNVFFFLVCGSWGEGGERTVSSILLRLFLSEVGPGEREEREKL